MDIIQMGTELLKNSMGGQGNQNTDAISNVLQKLIGSGDQLDIAGMISAMQSGGLASAVTSWLGDGGNAAVSESQVRDVIGSDKITEAAAQLGTDENALLTGLTKALPEMVDRSSSGGSLLDAIGGLDGAMDMAKKLF
jgi:uncharacterized protein YidB (DUF937 family)